MFSRSQLYLLPLALVCGSVAFGATFEQADRYPTNIGPMCIAQADFDGDHDIDLAVGHEGVMGSIWIYLNDGTGSFTQHHQFTAASLHTLIAADINDDGVVDLLTGAGRMIYMYFGDGDGTFDQKAKFDALYEDVDTSFFWFRDIRCLTAGDFDADGHTDLVFGDYYRPSSISVMWGTADDTLWEDPDPILTGDWLSRVKVADFDGDGDSDLMVNSYTLLLNNGDRTFTQYPPPGPVSAQPAHYWESGPAADMNADGKPDLVITSGGADCFVQVMVRINNGDSTFLGPYFLFQVAGFMAAPQHLVVADLDLNGFNDFIVPLDSTSFLLAAFNEGTLPWPSAYPETELVHLNFAGSECVAAADFDGDTDIDIAVVNRDGHLTIGRNIGSMHYIRRYVPDEYPTIEAALEAAVDGDTIVVRPGIYVGNVDFGGKDVMLITESELARVRGFPVTGYPSSSAETILQAGDSGSVVRFVSGETSMAGISGFIIQGGEANLGGGIYCYESSPVISHNTIRNNTAYYHGGGIFTYDSEADFHHNLLYGNTAVTWGGGMYLQTHNADMYNNTITQNSAGDEGEGMVLRSCNLTFKNSIIWGNSGSGIQVVTDAGTPVLAYSLVEGGWPGTGIIDADPLFVDPAAGDFRVGAGSPCIDAGDPSDPLDPNSTPCDMGAYWYGAPTAAGDGESTLPTAFALEQNYPNPFNAATRIEYVLPVPEHVTVSVYNVLGQQVVRLVDRTQTAGTYSETWDGRDAAGRAVASGVYLYRVQAGDYMDTRRMLLLK